jgi:glycosyltransferase involved in cell wall biosynthesis
MSTAVERPQVKATSGRGAGTIAFDTWCLNAHARNHGVHVYASKLLEHFRELAPQYGVEVRPYASTAADNDAKLLEGAPGFRPRETALLRFNRLWRFGGACALAGLHGADLVFSPHCTSLYIGNFAPAVITIHDVIPVHMPWASRRITATVRFCLWSAAKFSRAVITVSQHSKTDLLNLYGIPDSKVFVIYNGCNQSVFNNVVPDPERLHDLLARLGVARPYILHHGAIKPNKNLKRLIQSYRLLAERNRNLELDLVVAGPLGWEYEDVLSAASQGPGKVILTGALNDVDLGMLVKGASLAVFPSLYEGFCLPMIEAMACGVPTIAANSSCLPEVSGGVLRYFNPESVEEMSACIEGALENDDLRRELSEKGRARASQFDWRRCAEETMEVLKEQLAVSN